MTSIRAAITAALKNVGYLHISEGRREHTTRRDPYASTD